GAGPRGDAADSDQGDSARPAVDLAGHARGAALVQPGRRALPSRLDREARARLRDVAHLERPLTDPIGHALRPPPAVAPARRDARWHRTARAPAHLVLVERGNDRVGALRRRVPRRDAGLRLPAAIDDMG